jgi:hypothetical protein
MEATMAAKKKLRMTKPEFARFLGVSGTYVYRLAREGMRFTDFYAAQAVCSASRAALMTGCYPNRVGIYGALGPQSPLGLHTHELTMAEVLKHAATPRPSTASGTSAPIEFLLKVPLFVPFVVVGHAMRVFLAPHGTLNGLLLPLGILDPNRPPSLAGSWLGLSLALAWKHLALAALLFLVLHLVKDSKKALEENLKGGGISQPPYPENP